MFHDWWPWCFLLLLCAGCNASGGDAPQLVQVSGMVTRDGKPLPEATVAFHSQTPGQPSAFGRTDGEGRYTLTTSSSPGASPGAYQVTVSLLTDLKGQPIVSDPENGMDAQQLLLQGQARESIPPAYSDLQSTQLKIEVPAEGGELPEIPVSGS